jgi:hypothetical protein
LAPLTKRGVIDPQGNNVVNPTFAWIGSFSEGLAAAQPSEKNLYHWAYIDRKGKFAIDLAFNVNRASPFHDGTAWLSVPFLFAEQSKQIDRSGTVIKTLPARERQVEPINRYSRSAVPLMRWSGQPHRSVLSVSQL